MTDFAAYDIQNHLYPAEYVKYLQQRTNYPKLSGDPSANANIVDNGINVTHLNPEGLVDPLTRIERLRGSKIGVQISSLMPPGVYRFGNESVSWARKINDFYSEINRRYPDSYECFMTLPFADVEASMDEMERATKDLGLRGIGGFTNIDGIYLSDEKFAPLLEKAAKYSLPIYIHPTTPPISDYLKAQGISIPMLGYPFDTTICLTKIVWSGLLDKMPDLKIIAAHMGGFVPYFLERIEHSWSLYSSKYPYHGKERPGYYLKKIFYDTVNFHTPSLLAGFLTFGASNLLFGTDYPFRIEDSKRAVQLIESLPIPDGDKEAILWRNAKNLLPSR